MTWIWVLMAILLLGVTAAVAVGYGGSMGRAYPDRPELLLPADRMVSADDLEDVRFSVVMRGYRMDEVDDVVRRLVREIAERDARLSELTAAFAASAAEPDPRAPQHRPSSAGATAGPLAGPPADQQVDIDPDGRPGRHRVREVRDLDAHEQTRQ
ncbi:DivIVA domain-containing protein [Flindersiella endophytica]